MAQLIINVGTSANDGLGDPIRTAFQKTNTNFSDLFSHFQTNPPPTLVGSVGDFAGMIANDSLYFYYCFANYDGHSTIWGQLAQVGNVSIPSINNGSSNVVVYNNSGNVSVGVGGISSVALFTMQGLNVSGNISATGNVSGANLNAITLVTTTALSATANITGGNVSAVGNIEGSYILGNGYYLTGISGGGATYGNANVANYLPTYSGAITAANLSATGNITGSYILGNGSQLTGLPATYGNANVTTLLAGFGSNVVSTTGNITGSYILGNGSQLTGLPATYGNANLAALGSNPISTTGNITGGYILGNGSQLTGIAASYGNSNVAAYLPTYSGNLSANNLNIGNSFTLGGTPFIRTLRVGGRISTTTVPLATNNSFEVLTRTGNVEIYTT